MCNLLLKTGIKKSRQENSQELTQFSPRSHPRHLVEKGQYKIIHYQRHHKRQAGEQPLSIQVATAILTVNIFYFYI